MNLTHNETSKSTETGAPQTQDWTEFLIQQFLSALNAELTCRGRQDATTIVSAITERHRALVRAADWLIESPLDATHVTTTALVVAAAQVLEAELGPEARGLIDDTFNAPLREHVLAATATMLDEATDPFAALVAVSKDKEQSFFGPSFGFQRRLDDDLSYVLDAPSCLYHRMLVASGRPDLQEVLCRFDHNWIDAIVPERHQVRLSRPTTFATGNTCRMVFLRDQQPPAQH